jgi:hypothetical protein
MPSSRRWLGIPGSPGGTLSLAGSAVDFPMSCHLIEVIELFRPEASCN